MAGVNKVILLGRLGRDPELRTTASGQSVCNFSVATSEKWKDKDGTANERTEWHNIVAWAKLAEICAEYLGKGREVYVEGKLQTSKYTDKEGVERYKTEVVAQTVQFVGGQQQDKAAAAAQTMGGRVVDDEQIPF